MSEVIDLDKLLPEPKEVKISGKVVKVFPGKLKVLIKIQKAFSAFQGADASKQMDLMDGLIEALAEIMPDLKDPNIDISVEQLPVLVNMAYESAGATGKATTENKMDVGGSNTEKKTAITSPEQ